MRLAIAVGVECVQRGMCVRFFTPVALARASHSGALEQFLKDIGRVDVVIIDELGYVPFGIEGARLLFLVMNDCYEKRGMVITVNIELSKWGVVFADDKLASATIDRIVRHTSCLP